MSSRIRQKYQNDVFVMNALAGRNSGTLTGRLSTLLKGQPVMATEFAVSKLDAMVTVPMGQAVLASGVQTKSKTDHARTLIVVTARVIQ
jgi:hypothetical protein